MNAADDIDYAIAWLRLALGDLALARAIVGDSRLPPRGAAAAAQQAAEKALKAAIAAGGTEPPRSHDLAALARLLPDALGIRALRIDLRALSHALQGARYPFPEETPYEADEAARLVEDSGVVVRAVGEFMATLGVDVTALEPR